MNIVHAAASQNQIQFTNVNAIYAAPGVGRGYSSGAISAAFGNRPKMPPVWTKTIRSP